MRGQDLNPQRAMPPIATGARGARGSRARGGGRSGTPGARAPPPVRAAAGTARQDLADRGRRTVGHQDQPIGEIQRLVDVVRHHHDDLALDAPRPAAACPAARTASANRASRTARRAAGIAARVDKRARQRHALLGAQRQLRRHLIGGVADADQIEIVLRHGRGACDASSPRACSPRRARRSRAPSATAAATATERRRRDRHRARHLLAVDDDAAEGRPLEPGDDRQHRRLAAARSGRGCRRTRRRGSRR